MNFFDSVARAVMEDIKGDLLNVHFVFPNRRGGVFFSRSLTRYGAGRVIMPYIETLADVYGRLSALKPCNEIRQLITLYHTSEAYCLESGTMDMKFGERASILLENMMLWDMHYIDVDKMLDECLNWAQLGGTDYLSESQKSAVWDYWGVEMDELEANRDPERWVKKMRYLYHGQRDMMRSSGYGDDGMIARDAVDRVIKGDTDIAGQTYVFIGFNELTGCSKRLMSELKSRGQALFFWDYYGFIEPSTASSGDIAERYVFRFRDENVQRFPDYRKLRCKDLGYAVPCIAPKIHQIGINSHNGVCSLAAEVVKSIGNRSSADLTGTCLMLTKTEDLKNLIVNLPEGMEANITMSLPMRSTPIMSWIEQWFSTLDARQQVNNENAMYHRYLSAMLLSPITQTLDKGGCLRALNFINKSGQIVPLMSDIRQELGKDSAVWEMLTDIFGVKEGRGMLSALRKWLTRILQADEARNPDSDSVNRQMLKSLCYAMTLLNEHLNDALSAGVDFGTDTMKGLIMTYARMVRVNFIGHPLNGVQIMGSLEARGLDLERLIVVGANEADFMQPVLSNSLIPSAVSAAYGMPTHDDERAIASYNFMRMMSHVGEVWFLWDSRESKPDGGQVSHYVKILNTLYGALPELDDDRAFLSSALAKKDCATEDGVERHAGDITVQKTEQIMDMLRQYTSAGSKRLSASALNTYLNCPLQFYMSYLLGIFAGEEISEDIEATKFGNIFHKTMQELYLRYEGKDVTAADYDSMLADDESIMAVINKKFTEEYYPKSKKPRHPEGQYLVACHVIHSLVRKQLTEDKQYSPIHYVGSEINVEGSVVLPDGTEVKLRGIIDRVDIVGDALRIIDYKTGKVSIDADKKYSLSYGKNLFAIDKERPSYGFQALMYTMMLNGSTDTKIKQLVSGRKLQPYIFMVCRPSEQGGGAAGMITEDYRTGKYASENNKEDDLREFFESGFRRTLEELFDASVPLCQTAKVEKCRYCNFATICGRVQREFW